MKNIETLIAALIIAIMPFTACKSLEDQQVPATVVNREQLRDFQGNIRYYITLEYEDKDGVNITTKLEVNFAEFFRYKNTSRACVIPRGFDSMLVPCRGEYAD